MPSSHLRVLEKPPDPGGDSRSGAGFSHVTCPITLQRYENGQLVIRDASIAVEDDMRVQVRGGPDMLMSRTPGDDLNLVMGHLFSRSMIKGPGDVLGINFNYHGFSRVEVVLKDNCSVRRIFPSPKPVSLAPARLFDLKRTFERRQSLYKNTHSTHAAALFSLDGELVAYGEDVGRHNALDKAIGKALLEGTLGRVIIAVLSSRLALELAVKACTANIPILCGFSAATSSGINYAEMNNLTLVGRLRRDSFNIYANGWRLRGD